MSEECRPVPFPYISAFVCLWMAPFSACPLSRGSGFVFMWEGRVACRHVRSTLSVPTVVFCLFQWFCLSIWSSALIYDLSFLKSQSSQRKDKKEGKKKDKDRQKQGAESWTVKGFKRKINRKGEHRVRFKPPGCLLSLTVLPFEQLQTFHIWLWRSHERG